MTKPNLKLAHAAPEEIKIEKGVPLPASGAGRPSKYPWGDMEVGDSFFAEAKPESMHTQAAFAGRKYGRRFTTRKRTENGVAGVRVWRVE